jgi:hypothetical protein
MVNKTYKENRYRIKSSYPDKITISKVGNHTVKKGYSNVRCPKCNGNIFFDGSSGSTARQQDESTGWCLQCGYIMYTNRDRILAEQLASVTIDSNNS